MELFGPEFDDVRLFYEKKIFLFEHHKKELDHVVKTTELLNLLLKEKFSEKQKIHLENLARVIRRYWYNEEDQRKLALPIYYSFLDYMQEMTYMIRSEEVDPPFETYADVMYDVIQLLKVLVEEKKLEKYPPKDKRFQAVCRKCYIRQLSLFRLGYKVFRDEFWQELYLDESIAQPKSVLYVLDLNPITYKTDKRYKEFTKKYFPYVDQIIILRRPYKKENEKLVKEWYKKYGQSLG